MPAMHASDGDRQAHAHERRAARDRPCELPASNMGRHPRDEQWPDELAGHLIERGTARLKPVAQTTYRSGDSVRMPADVLHRVLTMAQTTTISVVVNGPGIRAETSVYTPGRLALLPHNVPRRLTPAEVGRAVVELRSALQSLAP